MEVLKSIFGTFINYIINEYKIGNKVEYNRYNKEAKTNEFIIKYKIGKEYKIRIFGDIFVKNNKSNFQMIINNKNYELNSFYNIKDENEKQNRILEIKLNQIKNI